MKQRECNGSESDSALGTLSRELTSPSPAQDSPPETGASATK